MDGLTAIMLVVVTGVSLLVQVYSTGYMKGDPGYARYFAFMSFFTASMVGLVVASNVIQLFVFWELVGLSSYLLIGFWYHKPSAAAAAKKAFLVTRLGDFGFLLAIFYLFFNGGTFTAAGLDPLDIPDIHEAMGMGLIAPGRGYVDRAWSLRGRGGQVRPVPAAHVATRRNGRSNAGELAHPRCDDGGGGRVPGWRGSSPSSRPPKSR